MLTSQQIIERVRAHIAAEKHQDSATDYAVAKALEINRQSMTMRKQGLTKGMADSTAIRAADLLGLPREYVLACVQAERAERQHSPAAATWRKIADFFGRAVSRDAETASEAPGDTIAGRHGSNSVYSVKFSRAAVRRRIWAVARRIPAPLFA